MRHRLLWPCPVCGYDPDEPVNLDDDFGTILVCAERYALGRQSYMPKLVIDYITPLLPRLADKALSAMLRDLEDPVFGFGDPRIDEPGWIAFREKIREELNRRKEGSHV